MSTRVGLLAMSIVLVTAACTSDVTSTPGPTLTVAATTTTTTSPPTTTAPPAPSTTDVASTTTAAPTTTLPSGPADENAALLVGGADSTGWLSLGAWQRTRWQRSADPSGTPIPPDVAPGTEFVVSNLAGETAATTGSNAEACFDGRVGPTIDVDVAPPDPPGFGYNAIAVADPSWQLTPRRVAVIDDNVPAAYQDLGEAAFADEPVDATTGSIEQLVVADLDGDGDDEALMAFESVQSSAGPGTPGDLATLLLVEVGPRTAETVLLSAVGPPVDDFSFPFIERYRVLDLADLNGDGRMEVIVHAWYYEGAAVVVYEYDGTRLREVLAVGCGA